MMFLLVLGVIGLFGGLIGRSVLRGDAALAALERAWNDAAARLGGELEVLDRAGVRVLRLIAPGESRAVASVSSKVVSTTVRCRYALGHGPRFELRWRMLGNGKDLPAGFWADDTAQAATVLDDEARERMAAFPRLLTVRANGRELELSWPLSEDEAGVLVEAVELAQRMAGRGLSEMTRLADALDGRLDAGQLRVQRGAIQVWLAIEERDGVWAFVASVPARVPCAPFRLRLDADALSALPPGLCDPERSPQTEGLGDAALRGDGEAVEVIWPGAPSDDEARAAVRLLEALGAPRGGGGAFR